jgi:type I restriction enzyme M protein
MILNLDKLLIIGKFRQLLREYNLDLKNFIPQISESSPISGFFMIPKWFRNVVINLLNPTLSDSVLNLSMGTGTFLVDCIEYLFSGTNEDTLATSWKKIRDYVDLKLYATESNCDLRSLAKLNFLMNFGVDFPNIVRFDVNTDKRSNARVTLPKSDIIIMSSPVTFHVNISVGSNVNTNMDPASFSELDAGLNSLRVGGRMAAIVPEVFMFSKDIESLRHFLVKRKLLKAIIALPPNLFSPYNNMKHNLIIFERPDQKPVKMDPLILMVDTRNIEEPESTQFILRTFAEKYRTQDFSNLTKPIFARSYSLLKNSWSVRVNADNK